MSEQAQWQVTGSAAEVYEQYLVPAIFGPLADQLLAVAAPRVDERVLDLACGTGAVARKAAALVGSRGSVVGLDLNPGMLAVAQSLPLPGGAAIHWRLGNAVPLPFDAGSFDLVLCQQGLQFFPDRLGALREVRRVLASAGRVALAVWCPIERSPGFAVLAEGVARYLGPEAAIGARSPFSLGDATDLSDLLTDAGFRDLTVRDVEQMLRFPSSEDFVGRYTAGSVLAVAFEQTDDAQRNALVQDFTGAMRALLQDGELVFPIATHLATAKA